MKKGFISFDNGQISPQKFRQLYLGGVQPRTGGRRRQEWAITIDNPFKRQWTRPETGETVSIEYDPMGTDIDVKFSWENYPFGFSVNDSPTMVRDLVYRKTRDFEEEKLREEIAADKVLGQHVKLFISFAHTPAGAHTENGRYSMSRKSIFVTVSGSTNLQFSGDKVRRLENGETVCTGRSYCVAIYNPSKHDREIEEAMHFQD